MAPPVPQHILDRIHHLPERLSDLAWKWEATAPDSLAVIDGDISWIFGELATAVREAAGFLTTNGIRPGDRVMLVNENGRAIIALLLAAASLGAWAIVINARQTAAELAAVARHAGTRRAFYTVDASADAEAHAVKDGAVIIEDRRLGRIGAGPLFVDAVTEPVESAGRDQVALLVYTSGTTGVPKGVMLTHRNLLFIAAVSGGMRGFRQGDLVYGILPLSHVFGLASVFLGALYAGACYMPQARYDGAQLEKDIGAGITHLQGVPAMYARFLGHLRQTGKNLGGHRIRFTSAGGAPLDLALKHGCEALFGQPLHNGYGMTEASPSMAMTRIDFPRQDGSVGQPLPHVELIATGAEGQPLADGEVGEIRCRGPGVMKGYYKAPDLTAQAITPDGWLITGDVGYFDGDGSLHIAGRSKELIIRSGFNVFPPEVEGVLSKHPKVVLAAVIGVAAGDGNEEVVAYVQVNPADPPHEAELAALCAENLAPYRRPSRYILCASLPATTTGKILKAKLVAEAVPLA